MHSDNTSTLALPDDTACEISLYVMPDRAVVETLVMQRILVMGNVVEAEFDRHYKSSMKNSPDHPIYLSALVQLQKIVYAFMRVKLGVDYKPQDTEIMKLRPTELHIHLPRMVTNEAGLVHRIEFDGPHQIEKEKYLLASTTQIDNIIVIDAKAIVYLLG